MRSIAKRARGFAIVSAIFILVVLAALGAFIVNVFTSQQIGSALDVQGVRVYQAARAGLELGISRWINSGNCTATGTTIDGFTVTITTIPTAGPPAFCQIDSLANIGGVPGTLGYVERQLRAVIE